MDGRAEPVLHVSQLAATLGLPFAATLPAHVLAADTVALLDAWGGAIATLDFASLLEPTPSRGRTLRNLTVNVHHPFELLPAARSAGSFPWDPDRDGEREAALTTATALRHYAAGVLQGWRAFVAATDGELDARNPVVTTPRGAVPYSVVLDAQRWHAAYHLRQLEHVLGGGFMPPLDELALPADVF